MQPFLLRERINYIATELNLDSILEILSPYFENEQSITLEDKKN